MAELTQIMVKICGVATASSVYALDGLADYIGFVSSRLIASPRSLNLASIRALAGIVSRSRSVVVLHGYSVSEAVRAAYSLGVDVLQFHEPLSLEDLAGAVYALEAEGVKMAPLVEWKGGEWRPMDPCRYYQLAREILGPNKLEYLIIDAAKGLKGEGPLIPINEIKRLTSCIDVLAVAGGITPGNVCSVASLGPRLVDVSRGVERGSPGVKALDLALEFIERARRCSSP
jgi:phosphoribosylanthranilate isomerase